MFRPVEINLRAEMKNMVEMSSIGRAKTQKVKITNGLPIGESGRSDARSF